MSDGPPSRPIVGVGAVILEADRVLLVKRAHEPLKGEWSLPGGRVELGETLEDAVAREVLDRVHRAADGGVEHHFVIIDYLCESRGGTLAFASDADDVQWVPVAKLRDYRVTDQAMAVIAKAQRLSAARQNTPVRPAAR